VSLDDSSDNARGLEGRREPREKGTIVFLCVCSSTAEADFHDIDY